MLTLSLEPEDATAAFTAALAKRRWSAVEGLPTTWTCYFDAAFVEQVRRIVTDDVQHAAAEAGVDRFRGVCSVAAIETALIGDDRDVTASPRVAREVWSDGDDAVGPLGEVVVTLDRGNDALREALTARHWVRLADLPRTWMHRFDLGIFEPVEAIVRDELTLATRAAALPGWRAAWALATWGHVAIVSREPEPPGPYADWRW